jgi:hypothetical protein
MDLVIAVAARELAMGDPLRALNRIALRADAPALALRGLAMAQLGELALAKTLLRRAARAFGPKEAVPRARCVVAAAEIALVARDLGWRARQLDQARATLAKHGDRANAGHARVLQIRRLLLLGRVVEAERLLARFDPEPLVPASRAALELVVAGIAIRTLDTQAARAALARAARAAHRARIPALTAEVTSAGLVLETPAARRIARGAEQFLRLDDVEALLASDALVVDASHRVVRRRDNVISLARRPVLFAVARALAGAWPETATREALVASLFGGSRADESHRARLRVEIARLRKALAPLAAVRATQRGFALEPRGAREVCVLAPPVEDEDARVLALLADGEAWSSSSLALALATSQRTVQRSLEALERAGRVRSFGRARARRWTAPPLPGITTTLLLPSPLPTDGS